MKKVFILLSIIILLSSFASATVYFNDTFNRADSGTVGMGWTEIEDANHEARILSNALYLNNVLSTGISIEVYNDTLTTITDGTNLEITTRAKPLQTNSYEQLFLRDSGSNIFARIEFRNAGYITVNPNGNFHNLQLYNASQWYNITIYNINFTSDTYFIRIDNHNYTNSSNGYAFETASANLGNIYLSSNKASAGDSYWDYILITNDTEVTPPTPPSYPYHSFSVTNKFTTSDLQNVNVTITGGRSNLTDASGDASFSNSSGTINYNSTLTNYFKLTGSATENSTTNLEMFQSVITPACLEKITNNVLTCVNGTLYPNAQTYNFTIEVTDYYDVIQEETITALDNKTINFTEFYSSNLTFLNNFVTGNGNVTTNCLYNVTSSTYPSFNEIINGSHGSYIGLINGSYLIIADCYQYAYTNQTVNITNTTQNVTFDLYTTNSIDIFLFDETSGISLNGTNITVIKTLGAVQDVNYTSTGTISYSNLTAGNYTFSFEGDYYPRRNYAVTVGNKTYQTLNVYLLANSTDTVIFTFQKYGTNQVIEGVTETINKIINGSDTLIAVLTSDITGRTQFYFDTTDRYCFTVSKAGYTSKAFCLDPIIFNSYTISLEESVDASTGDDYEEILISYTPSKYWNNVNNTITFQFASPNGDLTNYGFNATYNANVTSASGTNAFGGVITNGLLITNAQYGDTVTLNYYYKLTGDAEFRTFKLIYDVYGYNSTTDSLVDNPPEDYGLGEFEKTLISVLIILLVAGASAYYGGALAGGLMALFMFAWVMYIGFLNFWAGIISVIILFVILAWRGTK